MTCCGMVMPRALRAVLDSLSDKRDPTLRIVRDLRATTADLDAAITDIEQAPNDADRCAARLRRVHALRHMIDTLTALEAEWTRATELTPESGPTPHNA